jgi:hypothetical protein
LWKPGVPEVLDEYKHEEFTMHGILFTTINDNPAQHNLSGQSKPTLLGRYLRNMAKTFKEIRIYGAPLFPRQETSIPGHGLSV